MKSLLEKLKGRKQYLLAVVVAGLAAASYLEYQIPEWVYVLLAAMGLTVNRAAIGKAEAPKRLYGLLLLLFAVPCFLIAGPGCSFLAPGADTRAAAEARSSTTWDQDSNLTLQENTTHNRRVVAAEGDDVQAEYYQDGTPKKLGGATLVLTQVSEPHDVMQGYMKLAEENAKTAAEMFRTMQAMLGLYAPVMMARETRPPASQPWTPSNVAELLNELRQ